MQEVAKQARNQTGFHRFTKIGQIFMNDSQKKISQQSVPRSPPRTLRLRRLLFRKSVTISSRSAPGKGWQAAPAGPDTAKGIVETFEKTVTSCL